MPFKEMQGLIGQMNVDKQFALKLLLSYKRNELLSGRGLARYDLSIISKAPVYKQPDDIEDLDLAIGGFSTSLHARMLKDKRHYPELDSERSGNLGLFMRWRKPRK